MGTQATAYNNSSAPKRENLRPVSSDLRRHPQHSELSTSPTATMLPQLFSGTIRFFDHGKSYGFIETPDDGPDVFFYLTALQKPFDIAALKFPAQVEYEVFQSRKGPRASKVWLAGAR